MCRVLNVSKSGFYAWIKNPESKRTRENRKLVIKIKSIHKKSNNVYGSRKITRIINKTSKTPINHKRIERLMSKNNIYSKTRKKYKATTNSHHNLPVAENLLNREFKSDAPNKKLVSDITYISTEEGWLYVAGILDLYGKKIVGLSMSTRMTKDLVIRALEDAYKNSNKHSGAIMHSDRGSQYCSKEYQAKLKEYGYTCSMSRKGNCWDNAPMESFWGKMKMEWLNDQHFRTIKEAKSKVFEYIMFFYNRERIHAENGYITPEEYYSQGLKLLNYKAA